MILSAAAVGQSFFQSTAGAQPESESPTETATATTTPADGSETPTEVSQPSPTAPVTGTPESTGLTGIDVESRFQRAKSETLPGENWSTQQVREASGDRGLTVVATQGFYVSGQTAELAALTPNGSVVYFNDTYRVYFDVDPVEGERYTVEYVASKHFEGENCSQFGTEQCTRNVVNRVNLTTGEDERVYSEMTPGVASTRWHDVDRLNETHLIVADIYEDSVFVVDTRDDSIVWEWYFDDHYSRDAGGQGGDWTHVNDVEVLPDGRIMLSPRNMDEVIFLEERDGGYAVNESWTLGEDDNHDILYEQHNADYVPPAYGGPAVIVADSENDRVVEFQRVDGEWVESWSWRDVRLKWPRDADRLPNGNTLIVDTHGNRLVELNANDEVVWSADVGMPYDVERIGTGDESEGGPAARLRERAPIEPRTPSDETDEIITSTEVAITGGSTGDRPPVDQFWLTLKESSPPIVTNSILYAAPPWVLFTDLAFAALFLLTGLVWAVGEFYWAGYTLRGVASGGKNRLVRGVDRVR
jgi:hypothetical protein